MRALTLSCLAAVHPAETAKIGPFTVGLPATSPHRHRGWTLADEQSGAAATDCLCGR